MNKVLVIGASGRIGRHLYARVGRDLAIATYRRRAFEGGIHFDPMEMPLADIVPDPSNVAYAVLLLSETRTDYCFAHPKETTTVNVDAVMRVAEQLDEWGIHLVFTSSEFVFDGEKGDYNEDDAPNPIMVYGRQKLAVEGRLAEYCSGVSILRVAKTYGEDPEDGTLFTALVRAVSAKPAIRCAADQRFSPVHVDDVASAIVACGEGRFRGVFHLAGPEGISRIDALEMTLQEIRRHRVLELEVIPCSIDDFELPERRPKDVSMRPNKLLSATGLSFRRPEEACRQIVNDAFQKFPLAKAGR